MPAPSAVAGDRPRDDHPSERRVHAPALVLVLGTLIAFMLLNAPSIGNDAWVFEVEKHEPRGLLAPVVRAAGSEFDLGILRSSAIFGAMGVLAVLVVGVLRRSLRRWLVVVVAVLGASAVLAPAVVEQAALRDATAPWYYSNDASYQTEIAGDLLLHGTNPYGYDYRETGLLRWYSFDGSIKENADDIPQLRHFPYYPGTAVLGAASQLVPAPFDDVRFVLLLATLALIPACLLLPGPWAARLTLGVALAANPLMVRMAWFAMMDAPTLLAIVVAFGLAFRQRLVSAAIVLAIAVLLKQFALAAVPFLALYALQRGGAALVVRAGAAFLATVAVVAGPFIVMDPSAFWNDTFRFGTSEYRLLGYGLAGVLTRLGIYARTAADYPFSLLALVVWMPVTAVLLWVQARERTEWAACLGFAGSVLTLVFIARVFQAHYVAYPMLGLALALTLAASNITIRVRRPDSDPSDSG